MERLFAASHIGKRDIELIYGAIFLAAFSSFEGMLEELFLSLLVGSVKASRRTSVRQQFGSFQTAREIVLSGRRYIDWIPYEKTAKLAEAFFTGGRPFTFLDKTDIKFLYKMSCVRNAIAHSSRHALRVFQKEILDSLPLLPSERKPTSFLRSIYITPDTTRYQQYADDLAGIMQKICI
jgi:hypothetical protein